MQNPQTPSTKVASPAAVAFLARAGAVVLSVLVLALMLEALTRILTHQSRIFQSSVDIQSAGTLHAKIADFQARPGRKIVIMGDSLVYGQTMAQHGDAQWQDATLARQLVRRLREKLPGEAIEILDLGMNGALPVDLVELARIVSALKPDLLVFDLTLRSFSRDFNEAATQRTRPWLNSMTLGDGGSLRFDDSASLDGWFRSWVLNNSALFRLRDFGQSAVFGGQPAAYFLGLRNEIDRRLRGERLAAEGGDDEIILMLRARARYARIDLDPDNIQRQALDRLVAKVAADRQPTLVFYATENAEIRDELIAPERFAMLETALRSALQTGENPLIRYVGPLNALPPKNFLDHVHLDRHGYRILSEALAGPALDLLIGKPAR